jgi:uncharacterized integral membrane protein
MKKIIGEIFFAAFSLPMVIGVLVAFVGAGIIIVAAALVNDGQI